MRERVLISLEDGLVGIQALGLDDDYNRTDTPNPDRIRYLIQLGAALACDENFGSAWVTGLMERRVVHIDEAAP